MGTLLNSPKNKKGGIKVNKYFYTLILFVFFNLTTTIFADKNDSFIGYWMMNNNKVVIEIEQKNNIYFGHVRWLKEPHYPEGDPMAGKLQIDRKNPDVTLRNRAVLGLEVVGDLKYNKEKNQLEGGWIYDSWNGRLYHGRVQVVDKNTLKLIGSFDKYGILRYSMDIKRVEFNQKKSDKE